MGREGRAGVPGRRKAPAGVGTRGPSGSWGSGRRAGPAAPAGEGQWNWPSSVEPFRAVVEDSGLIAVLTMSK